MRFGDLWKPMNFFCWWKPMNLIVAKKKEEKFHQEQGQENCQP